MTTNTSHSDNYKRVRFNLWWDRIWGVWFAFWLGPAIKSGDLAAVILYAVCLVIAVVGIIYWTRRLDQLEKAENEETAHE